MRTILVAILAIYAASSFVTAQVPDALSFQGLLTEPNGDPVADDNYNILTKMYKGSSVVWQKNHVGVESRE